MFKSNISLHNSSGITGFVMLVGSLYEHNFGFFEEEDISMSLGGKYLFLAGV